MNFIEIVFIAFLSVGCFAICILLLACLRTADSDNWPPPPVK